MKQSGSDHTTPFPYLGLLLLAGAVVSGLMAENPNASEATVMMLETGGVVSIAAGIISLLLEPIRRIYRATQR